MTSDKHLADLCFRDDRDWLEAILFLIILLVLPPAIIAAIMAPRDVAPLTFVIPFTIMSLCGGVFMLKSVLAARTRELRFDRGRQVISLTSKRPFQCVTEDIPLRTVDVIIFERTDNDGYWYKAMLQIIGGRCITFAQGGYGPDVQSSGEDMLNMLTPYAPHISIVEQIY